jgi:hypothetical protein
MSKKKNKSKKPQGKERLWEYDEVLDGGFNLDELDKEKNKPNTPEADMKLL